MVVADGDDGPPGAAVQQVVREDEENDGDRQRDPVEPLSG
jgi:hypothetical protein